ncbi:MAG: 23S rRNA (uridine(2552)-2'-O)-methyltransferase RlmE [Xanthomonadales bacterium]|nr:23S rRNA (uridine(2552)-2'-O)-methyltransferase RlmE [Gammaproteobacteria bacterium]MBT8050979.1 23S rRNA (uridine(2552)-2'-O)-methyltransferase RlmE [Gammaproteobacteria bacterium]MBT8056662.1 23S rRNA (uridine(2552)-2'-O)-methyltransferase RlmE [Gammaproteobacteria bacterium]NNJ79849.1 23S rRNA (uridine(2552)-2'-O)-methyltransferase RlmE [Xanthomonadales bacterium]NNL03773.1 23S rRNA (uridine(2552)-2'-O)-methyltransferase RlmE [Xanthomonadales bacterium]
MGKSKSSRRWLNEHFDDHYVRLAQQQGLRSRSAFKLLELQEKYRLIKPGMTIVDLGAAPGGWCQVVQPLVGASGRVIGLDILEMEPLHGVDFICGDFTEDEPLAVLEEMLGGAKADLVLSDMAPNMSGMAAIDQAKAMYLAELALEFVREHLKPGGAYVVKLFQGTDFDHYVREVRSLFDKVQVKKPKASRPRSREVYLLARGHRME